jgi:ATP-dependent DNA helicase RecG
MLEDFFAQNESKTLEFKEGTKSLTGIVKTIIAFANTSGGTLIIGVRDKTKEVIGLSEALQEEEKLANAIADSIAPLLVPDIEIHSYRDREVIIIRVPHVAGPFYLKSEGVEQGVYVRFGSTNRKADPDLLSGLKLFAKNLTYDELPLPKGKPDWDLIKKAFLSVKKEPSEKNCEMLGIFSSSGGYPTIGGVLLFDINRLDMLPDSIIRCARFSGKTKEKIMDQVEIHQPLPFAIEEVISFIERNTRLEGHIGRIIREDIPEYPSFAVREAVINAIVHTDYSMKGCHIQIAIFDDRIEFTNPGGLPFGQTIQKALAGFSRLRNRVLGRVFRELNLIEQWGSGLQRIISICQRQGLQVPIIEEINNHFRLTIFSTRLGTTTLNAWEEALVTYLIQEKTITTKDAAKIWQVSDRTARSRLNTMLEEGVLQRIGTSPKDPRGVFVLKELH